MTERMMESHSPNVGADQAIPCDADALICYLRDENERYRGQPVKPLLKTGIYFIDDWLTEFANFNRCYAPMNMELICHSHDEMIPRNPAVQKQNPAIKPN